MPEASDNPWIIYGLVLLTGAAGAAGDILVFHWAKHGGFGWMLLSVSVFTISVISFGLLLRFDSRSLGAAFLFVTMLHTLSVLACDRFFFGERFSRMEWLGLIFAVVAIVLLELGHAGRQPSPTNPETGLVNRTVEEQP